MSEKTFNDFQTSYLLIKHGELPVEKKLELLMEIVEDAFSSSGITLDIEETIARWDGIGGDEN